MRSPVPVALAFAFISARLAIGAAAPPVEEFPAALGSFATTLAGSSPARTQNVRLAVQALDGVVLFPGEVLSFNRRVGPRSAERGYQPAPVILREARQVQVGGGVCQVASTVFVAALLAGLSADERHRHSSPVDYIPLGEDATIAWGAKDLRIRNDLEQKVRLRVDVLGSTLAARFDGEQEGPESFDLETVELESPAPDDAAGLPGRDVELYRVRRTGAQETARELVHRDHYPPSRTRDASR
ncbi:MAG: VanW family protein [Candidatus Eisenbacteria bacterium]|nr:VanW family protein [Candidatus Eisenbacteria bacterium]